MIVMDLIDWSINYVKHKDLADRKLLDFEVKDETIKFRFKEREVFYFVMKELDERVFKMLETVSYKTIVCNHNKKNFDFLVEHWKRFSKIENLTIIFFNEKGSDKWLVNPFMHSKVADEKTLKHGLKAMYDAAECKVFL